MTAASGRGVLVTGSSRGVGAATARAFAERGDRVVVHYRSAAGLAEELLTSLPGSGHALVQADLADPDAVPGLAREAVEALGRVDVLVNNAALFLDPAGGSRRGDHRVTEVGYEDWVRAWRTTLDTNLLGPANLTWCVARHMMAVPPADGLPRGRVVNVGSRGAYRGEPDVPAYGASKAGLNALGQSLAQALAPRGIVVGTVAPGFVETEMAEPFLAGPAGPEIRAQSPMGRVARPEEVATVVLFLAAPGTEFTTGTIIDVNGASYLRS